MTKEEEFSRLAAIEKWPRRGVELQKEYVIPARCIRWDTKKKRFQVLTSGETLVEFSWILPNVHLYDVQYAE